MFDQIGEDLSGFNTLSIDEVIERLKNALAGEAVMLSTLGVPPFLPFNYVTRFGHIIGIRHIYGYKRYISGIYKGGI